ncbi:hypothetical protein TNCV_3303661 [Trichonephila clavipes]|nr:hypothetical protein TNCV_3303661 [Trichonephila clavipes]
MFSQQDGMPYRNDVTSYFKAEVPICVDNGYHDPSNGHYDHQIFHRCISVKDQAYTSLSLGFILEQKSRLETTINLIDRNIQTNLWQELIYR